MQDNMNMFLYYMDNTTGEIASTEGRGRGWREK